MDEVDLDSPGAHGWKQQHEFSRIGNICGKNQGILE